MAQAFLTPKRYQQASNSDLSEANGHEDISGKISYLIGLDYVTNTTRPHFLFLSVQP